MHSIRVSAVLAAALVAMVSSANAALIAPNTNVFALNEPGPVGGAVIASQTIPIVTATYTASLTSKVIQGDVSNPLGGLTFTYEISNNAVSPHPITRLAVNGFAGFLTDMSYSVTGAVAPTLNDRDAGGNVVGFTYFGAPIGPGVIAPGSVSDLMVVQTNAQGFQPTLANVIDGSVGVADSYAPRVIPEPASAGLVVAAAGLLRRRR